VAQGLDRNRFEVFVGCLERAGAYTGRLPQPGNVRILGKRHGFSLPAVLRLAREIARIRPHVLHTHNLGPLIYGSLASAGGRWCPILHGEHGLLPEECEPRRLRQRARLYRCCRKVHTVSQGLRQKLVELGMPASKIVALLNGVDTGRFTPGSREAARQKIGAVPPDAKVLGIVGRFDRLKGHAVLIEAFNRLAVARPEVHLLIVGGHQGSESARITALAQASPAAARIHLVGYQADPVPCYQAMDLLVAPSLSEGLSNVVLEAMACRVPVLAHPARGNAEMISHGRDGLICDLATADKLHAELERVLSDPPLLDRIGSAARETAVHRFSIAQMIRNYERLYREVARPADVTATGADA